MTVVFRIDMLAKENEVLKKTLDEKEKIVKVLMDERDELKVRILYCWPWRTQALCNRHNGMERRSECWI